LCLLFPLCSGMAARPAPVRSPQHAAPTEPRPLRLLTEEIHNLADALMFKERRPSRAGPPFPTMPTVVPTAPPAKPAAVPAPRPAAAVRWSSWLPEVPQLNEAIALVKRNAVKYRRCSKAIQPHHHVENLLWFKLPKRRLLCRPTRGGRRAEGQRLRGGSALPRRDGEERQISRPQARGSGLGSRVRGSAGRRRDCGTRPR
jgi:hypothetical protein